MNEIPIVLGVYLVLGVLSVISVGLWIIFEFREDGK